MAYPEFFDTIPTLTLRDPLAELLGSATGGLITYSYKEIVKLTGHSCPTVAGAWLMTCGALQRLYPDQVPERGNIAVMLSRPATEGVIGVIASVASFITGATTDTGFKGLRGRFNRCNLLHFEQPVDGDLGFQRVDTGARVTASFDASVVPPPSDLMAQLLVATGASPTVAQQAAFASSWQDRVKRIFENADHSDLVRFQVSRS